LLTATAIAQLPETTFIHPLNPNAIRHAKDLAKTTGCLHLGVHLVRVAPGHYSTEYHRHRGEEEFIYILSGRGRATIGEAEFDVQAGDFMGFGPDSLAHSLYNSSAADLVYLMGGTDLDYDVVDYPQRRQRLYRVGDRRTYEHLEP
ncbi:MAG TPA: cupin domain-containing protein, partial [Candidatus Obscuribacterales bacterium]